jgi:hypothetical protein
MKKALLVCAVAVLALWSAGCSYEKRLGSSMPGPPPWTLQTPEDTEDVKYFVGVHLADNVLDERTGRSRSMENAYEVIAESLRADVRRESLDVVKERGAAHLGEDEDDATYYRELRVDAHREISGAQARQYYWEKWRVREGLFHWPYTRYKYYVLAEVPRAEYEKVRQSLAERIAVDAAGGD